MAPTIDFEPDAPATNTGLKPAIDFEPDAAPPSASSVEPAAAPKAAAIDFEPESPAAALDPATQLRQDVDRFRYVGLDGKPFFDEGSPNYRPPVTDPADLKRLREVKRLQVEALAGAGDDQAKTFSTVNRLVESSANDAVRESVAPYDQLSQTGDVEGPLGAFSRGVVRRAGGAGGGMVGMTAAAALAPETGGLSILLPLLGGFAGSQVGTASQEALQRIAETPEATGARTEQASNDERDHYWAGKAADLATVLPFFRPSPTQLLNTAKAVGYLRLGAAVPEEAAAALKQTLGTFGIGAGQHVGVSALTGQPITLEDTLEAGGEMALFSTTTKLGKALGLPSHEDFYHERQDVPEISPAVQRRVDDLTASGLSQTAEAIKAHPGAVVEDPLSSPAEKANEAPTPESATKPTVSPTPEAAKVTETPFPPDVVETPEGADSIYKVQAGRATGTAVEYPERIVLKDLVSLDEGKGDGTAVLDALKAKGKPIELAAGQRSTDTPIERLTAFYQKRGFEPIPDEPGRFRWTPPEVEAPAAVEGGAEEPSVESATPAPPAPPAGPTSDSATPTGGNNTTSIKNAQVDIERAERGLPPAMEPARRDFGEVWTTAMNRIAQNPDAPESLVRELAKSPRPVDDTEDALLLHRQITLQNEFDGKAAKLAAAVDNRQLTTADGLRDELKVIGDKLLELHDVTKAVGTENSRGLNARKMMANEDYSLAKMITTRRAANGGEPLTPDQTAETERLHREINEKQAALQAHVRALQEKASEDAFSAAHEELLKEAAPKEGDSDFFLESEPEAEPDQSEEGTRGVPGVPVLRVKAGEIASRPDLMQFKRMDDSTTGINQEDTLTGKWDDRKAGVLLLWEPSDPSKYGLEPGQRYIVANGHHRLEFGSREGVTEFNSQVVREADGVSAQDARALGAEINIADGKGTVYDQAKFLRNYAAAHGPDEAVEAGRRIGARGRKAAQIALSATDRLFDSFTNGGISPDAAAAIAAAVPGNEAAQVAGMRYAALGKSAEQAANRARAELVRPATTSDGPKEFDLFGNEVFADIDAQAERATAEQKRLSEEIRAVRGAANKPELARKHGVDVADPEGVKKRIEELERERERWDNWPSHPDLVAITRQAAGGEAATPTEAAPTESAPKPIAGADKKAERKKFLEKAGEILTRQANEARKRIAERRKNFSANPFLDPVALYDHAVVGAEIVAKGATKLGRFTTKMVMEFGEYVRPQIGEIFAKSKEIHAATVSPRDLNAERESIVRGMKERTADGDGMGDLRGYVRKLALNFVRRGVMDRDALVDAVHGELKNIDPSLTRREAMDLISGYGHFKPLDPEAAKATLRDINGQLQQIGKLADMAAGLAPKYTGVKQREKSDAERRLIKEVNDAKKRGGFEITDPESQLRTALDAINTRLKNQIRDISERVATGEKPKPGTPAPRDEQTERLTALRDRIKQTLSALEPKAGLTDEQRVKVAMDATRRSLEEYQRRLEENDFSGAKKKAKASTPELEAVRAERDALRQEYEELRQLDESVIAKKEADKTRALEAQVAEIDRKFRTGDTDPSKSEPALLTPEQEALVSERDAMLRLLDEIRRNPKPKSEKQVEQLLKQVDALDERLRTGDIDPKKKGAVTPLSPEAERLMAIRDAMRREITDQRAAAKPVRSDGEIALQSWKTRKLREKADLERRIASNDFTFKVKQPVKLDAAGVKLEFETEQLKRKFHEALIVDQMARRSFGGKVLGGGAETLNLARALMTSFDLSAVLRQGGVLTIAHPVRAAKIVPDMIRALFSEEARYRIEREISERPNAHKYRVSKLALADNSTTLKKAEEAFMSRWVQQKVDFGSTSKAGKLGERILNLPLGGVRASERAYTTYMNRLRADSFDAMEKALSRTGTATTDEAKAISRFINVATGRPSLGATIDKAAPALNTVLFAPKYVASRFMILADVATAGSVTTGGKGMTRVRYMVAKEYARYAIGMALVYALAKAAGSDDISFDPRSSKFGKIKFGNTILDPLSGIAQATTLLGREASGETKTSSGKVVSLVHGDDNRPKSERIKYGGDDRFDVGVRFLRTKFSPVIGASIDAISGKNVVGQPVTKADAAKRLFIPLSYGDVLAAMQDEGMPRGAAIAALAILGMGVQNYDEKKKQKK